MSRGGKREGAGRKQGARTKKTIEFLEKAAAGGLMPLDYMLQVLRDLTAPRSDRLDAAKAAAPYYHSKMPFALVSPANPDPKAGQDDETVLNLYLSGLHAEADED